MNTKSCCMYYVPSIWILTSDGLRPKKGRDWAEPFWVSQNWAESSWQVSTFYYLHDCSNFLGSSLKVEPGLSKKAQLTIYDLLSM